MTTSQTLTDYFAVPLESLRAGSAPAFSVYLHFPVNGRMLKLTEPGEPLRSEFLEKYRRHRIVHLHVRRSDEAEFHAYLGATPASLATPTPGPTLDPQAATTAQNLNDALDSPRLGEESRKDLAQSEAQALVATLAQAKSAAEQEAANARVRDIVESVLTGAMSDTSSLVKDLWSTARIQPDLNHGVNVATLAAIFAMGFGRIDRRLVSDLALAGLLHDIGLSQVPAELITKPWTDFTPAERARYADHVEAGLALIDEGQAADLTPDAAAEVPERVRVIIRQHHEKFDGSGYPAELKGFQFDDVAQLLAMADLLESISSGTWDGRKRTLLETLETLEKLESSRNFPEYFNPDIFTAVLRWAKSDEAQKTSGLAAGIVHGHAEALLKPGEG